ncbi:hypothetical protein TMatcc_006685 [Talaromyces marneffei ATCC 18224]
MSDRSAALLGAWYGLLAGVLEQSRPMCPGWKHLKHLPSFINAALAALSIHPERFLLASLLLPPLACPVPGVDAQLAGLLLLLAVLERAAPPRR